MAATYRIVVSSISCYNSMVIDRRAQQAVHYCTGACQLLQHGLDCTVAHHSTCAELPDVPVVPSSCSRSSIEDSHQAFPGTARLKKGSSIQCSTSLKDITGEAINLASGKIKEFSFEKIKYSTNHVTFRKGRKVRPDSFSRRSTDLDIIYGHFGNEENCPPFGLLQKPALEEQKLSRSASLEQNINNTATVYMNSLTEDNLITKILEKTKTDSNTSGEDIKACLDILLKCSEDLKKCTDIIKQCIQRKSMGSDSDESGSPEVVYRSLMARLSTYLRRLPLELEQAQALRPDHSGLAELFNGLHSLQQAPFSPLFGHEQPPRYEDVVQNPPLSTSLPHSITQPQESQGVRSSVGYTKPVQSLSSLPSHTSQPAAVLQHGTITPAGPLMLSHSSDGLASTISLPSNKSERVCKGSLEALYIEEDADVSRREGKFGISSSDDRQFSRMSGIVSELGSDKLLESGRNGPEFQQKTEAFPSQITSKTCMTPKKLGPEQDLLSHSMQSIHRDDDIDKLLKDLECLSQNIGSEPPLEVKSSQLRDQPTNSSHSSTFGPGSSHLAVPDSTSQSLLVAKKDLGGSDSGSVSGEDDGALLLRILESIESFAQELVENGTGTGTQSKEYEVMRLLQDTLACAGNSSPRPQVSPAPVAVRDTGSSLLIQQTPEIIRIQNKPEKKPGTPPPAPAPGSSTPTPRPPTPPVSKVPVAPSPVSINIPRFYFPKGLPSGSANFDEAIAKIEAAFTEFEEEKADIYEMGKVAKACGCPLYWKAPMFNCAGGERTGFVSVHSFIAMWRKLLHSCYDDASKFVYLLAKPGCSYLEQEDFIPLLQDIVDTHPGLTFLKDAPEFHSRYITTVIQRIFYTVNRSWTGRISMTELRRSNFLQTLALLEEEDDINQITDYFSYEHFYVIYCKFWELDTDHDLFIDAKDLARYNDHASSNRIIERLFSGAVTRGNSVQREGRMSYADFVWFLISEEDKKNPTSVEYWFRCMDLDGDGVLSMYELEYFYQEQCERMEAMGIEPLPFHDLLCQMLDLVKPECQGKITLHDLKRCRMAHIFYDTFFNLEKYLDHEQRDPFAVQKDLESEGPEPSDWDKYALEEYEVLVAEETANDQLQEGGCIYNQIDLQTDFQTQLFL
uniref:Protein phosphatase 2 regulatory subunit B''alpha n=1 Tax=Scleropages formosus TaxID=113540 RepID=A0A8C9V2A0_SCLFO